MNSFTEPSCRVDFSVSSSEEKAFFCVDLGASSSAFEEIPSSASQSASSPTSTLGGSYLNVALSSAPVWAFSDSA
jgi:hypothetical protein